MITVLIKLLKAEGFTEGCLGVAVFATTGESWWLFALLALAPDLAMLGYVIGPRVGAISYNLAHSTIGPAVLAIVALALDVPVGIAVAAVWFAHIGFDRALGYGLKSTAAFKSTHLGELGAPCAGQ
jgi:hypothetical protein